VLIRSFYRGASGPELHVTTEAFRYALAYDWPYNVRQLRQALTTAMTIASREGWVGQPVLAEALEQQLPGLVASRRDSSPPPTH
jgi:transcriptional regulator with PAS, ATPase and Fis domain